MKRMIALGNFGKQSAGSSSPMSAAGVSLMSQDRVQGPVSLDEVIGPGHVRDEVFRSDRVPSTTLCAVTVALMANFRFVVKRVWGPYSSLSVHVWRSTVTDGR